MDETENINKDTLIRHILTYLPTLDIFISRINIENHLKIILKIYIYQLERINSTTARIVIHFVEKHWELFELSYPNII